MTVGRVLARLARGARRIRAGISPLAVVAVVAVLVVAGTLVWRMAGSGSGAGPGSGLGRGSTVRVGVADGDSVPAYVAAQRAELSHLVDVDPAGQVYALVSFDTYLTPAALAVLTSAAAGPPTIAAGPPTIAAGPPTIAAGPPTIAAGPATIAAYARVPLPGRQTELVRLPANRVPDDVVAGMSEVAVRKTAEAAADTTRAGQDGGSRALYESMAAVAGQEAVAYRGACACVYALLVRGSAASLAAFAGRSGVRVVDAAPEVDQVAYAVFVAPLPEQAGVVGPLPVDAGSP